MKIDLGKPTRITAKDAILFLQSSICECLQNSEPDCRQASCSKPPIEKNIFGRQITFSSVSDISYSLGFASTGLRAGIILCSKEIIPNLQNIKQAVRLHIPLVLFAGLKLSSDVHHFSKSGAVVLYAGTMQRVIDLLLLAYKIAESSLVPVVVCMEESESQTEQDALLPAQDTIANFIGNPDNFIESPTASQKIIFGKNRRRIPNWMNPDVPVSLGAEKRLPESALESAAQSEYFYAHLEEIIKNSFEEFNREIKGIKDIKILKMPQYPNIPISPISLYPYTQKDAEYGIITYGNISQRISTAVDKISGKNKFQSAQLVQLSPFPVKSVSSFLAGKKAITILEQFSPVSNHSEIFKEVAILPAVKHVKIFFGSYGSLPEESTLTEALRNMLPGGKGIEKFWLGVDFTKQDSHFPKHQVLLQTIEREYPNLQNKTIAAKEQQNNRTIEQLSNRTERSIPLLIRKYKDRGPAYSKLSRFYDDIASFFQTNPEELVADPFQAIPLMPPSTASFMLNQVQHPSACNPQQLLPSFDSSACTGCGDCFLYCPHAAINPLAIGIENLLKAGINIATANGVKITQLIPLIKNIAKAIHEEIKAKEKVRQGESETGSPVTPSHFHAFTLSYLILPAFEKTMDEMKLTEEKLQTARKDMKAIEVVLGDLPVSVTDVFYHSPDRIKNGTGELFTLAINTASCTGCSVCASVCEDAALKMTQQNSDLISSHQNIYALWEQLPDTASETISRLIDDSNYNSFSAILLSRYFNSVVNGKNYSPASDGEKQIIHLVAALAEAVMQPKIKETLKFIDKLLANLSETVHKQLGAALPAEKFESLAEVLSEMKESRIPFEEVVEKLGGKERSAGRDRPREAGRLGLVDVKSLSRKVNLVQQLKTLRWALSEGSAGTGRSRMCFVLTTTSYSAPYPWNNFISPVFVQVSGSSPFLAWGISEGIIRQIVDNIKILRRAELEVNEKYEPQVSDARIASVTYDDLTEKEKALVPPVILFGSSGELAGKDLTDLFAVLENNYPVKVIVLDDAALPNKKSQVPSPKFQVPRKQPLGLCSLDLEFGSFSLALPEHFFSGLSKMLNHSGPTLACLHTPNPEKHIRHLTDGMWHKLYSLALSARAFPVFDFNPNAPGNLLSSKINIEDNPQSEELWVKTDLTYKENGEEKTLPYSLTFADWAYTLKAWKDEFMLMPNESAKDNDVSNPDMQKGWHGKLTQHRDTVCDEANAVPVSDYILCDEKERKEKVPVILRTGKEGELKKYKVSEQVLAATRAAAHAWQVLREISGEVSEFPEKLHKKVEKELAEKYEKRLAEMKTEYERRIADLEQEELEKIRVKLKEKLLAIARQKD